MLSAQERYEEQRLTQAVKQREERIKRLEEIARDAKRPGVVALLEDVKVSAEACKEQIMALAEGRVELDEKAQGDFKVAVRFWGGQSRAYKGVVTDVEKASEKIAQMEELNAQDRERLRELREKQQAEIRGGKSRRAASVV